MENTKKIHRKLDFQMIFALLLMAMMIAISYPPHIDAQPKSESSTAQPPATQSELIQGFDNQNKLLTTINVTENPGDIAINPETNMVYVSHPVDFTEEGDFPTVSVIDGTTNELVESIPLRAKPFAIAVNPETNMVYVAGPSESNYLRNILHVIDGKTNDIIAILPIPTAEFHSNVVHDLAINSETNRIYLAVGVIFIVDGHENKILSNFSVNYNAEEIAVNSETNMVYVVAELTNTINVINSSDNKIVRNMTVSYTPSDIDVNPETNRAYVTNDQGSRISVINGATNEVVETIVNNFTTSGRSSLAVDRGTNMVYVLSFVADTLSVIDGTTNNIVRHFMIKGVSGDYLPIVPPGGYLAINPQTNMVYISSNSENVVSVINGKKNVILTDQQGSTRDQDASGIKVEHNPFDIAVNPVTNKIYVIYSTSNKVSVIDGNTDSIINTIPVGNSSHSSIAADAERDRIYLVNGRSNSLIGIDGDTGTLISNVTIRSGVPYDLAINPLTNMIYTLNHHDTFYDSISAINGNTNEEIKNLNLTDADDFYSKSERYANGLALDTNTNTIYITHYRADSISAIGGYYPEGKYGMDDLLNMSALETPHFIAINSNTNTLYVTNEGYRNVSEIDDYTGIILNNFTIPDEAIDVAVNPQTNLLYVASDFSNTVSIINLTESALVENVPVGVNPASLAINPETNMIYVTNYDSSTVSVIDGRAKRVIAGVTFNVNPSNFGFIQCDHATSPSPIEQYMHVYSGTQCTAKPNPGFEFVSWEENLEGNSTQLITVSGHASIWDSILDFLGSRPDEPQATIPITKFGTFTANFKELPTAVSSEYLIPLYGIIITTIVGWSIPSIIGWTKSKTDVRKLNYYHKQIASLNGDGKLDENDIEPLDRLRNSVLDAYSKGTINEKHYESLRNEVSVLYEKIFRKRIDDVLHNNSPIKKTTRKELAQIMNEVKYAYSEGKINEKHYDLLNKDILDSESKDDKN